MPNPTRGAEQVAEAVSKCFLQRPFEQGEFGYNVWKFHKELATALIQSAIDEAVGEMREAKATADDRGEHLKQLFKVIDKNEAEIRQLETDKAQLMAFATHFIQAGAWDAVEPDGGDIQDTAAKYGLLKEVEATEENVADWGHMADVMEVGDKFYMLAGPLTVNTPKEEK